MIGVETTLLDLLLVLGALGSPGGVGASADLFGAYRSAIPELPQPTSLAWADDDSLWITTAGDDSVRHVALDGTPLDRFGGRGVEPGHFRHPSAIAVWGAAVYVADRDNHRVQVLTSDGTFQAQLGGPGSGPGELHRPHGIALAEDRIAIADTGNDRVQVLDLAGRPLFEVGGWGSEAGRLIQPRDVAFAADGRLVVADTSNDRIQVFAADGTFETRFGGHGFAPGTVSSPVGVLARGHRVWVTDRDNHRIQVFDLRGGLRGYWGRHAIRPREGNGKLHYPDDFALAPDRTMAAVLEGRADRVQLYVPGSVDPPDAPGSLGSTTPHFGTGGGAGGTLLCVLQPEAHAVLVHDLRPGRAIEITEIGSFGSSFGQLRSPRDVWVDAATERIWVSDRDNRRLCAFELPRAPDEQVQQIVRAARFVLSVDFAALPADARRGLAAVPLPGALEGSPDGRLFVADERNGCIHVLGREHRVVARLGSPGSLERPTGLAFDAAAQRLYAVDAARGRVLTFATAPPTPEPLHAFGAFVDASGRFGSPFGIALDASGRLVVCDRERHVLERFERDGTHVETIGGVGLERGQFFKPTEVIALPDGRLCIVDQGNHRLQFLRPDGRFDEPFGARLYTKPARQD